MQDDTVMKNCKSMLHPQRRIDSKNYIVLESMIEEESKVNQSDRKKMTGRFKIASSEKNQVDDSIIRILPGVPRVAIKDKYDISPVLTAIKLTKLETRVDQEI
jgi:hypothetical protein